MDDARFDDLAKRLAGTPSRRAVVKGLLGSALGLLGARLAPEGALAAPAISLTPAAGGVRTRVTVSLSGFKRLEPFEIRWYNGSSSQVVAANTATRGGSRTISFPVPNAWRGTHAVRAAGSMGSQASASFRVVQSLSLSPEQGPRDAVVRATLRGFKARAPVQIRFFAGAGGSAPFAVLGSTTVSSTGTGTVTFTIPGDALRGRHRVEARETASGVLRAATFTVTGKCDVAGDCPAPANGCLEASCVNGACGTVPRPAGSPSANQTPGDCRQEVCDGSGGVSQVDDDTDLPDDGKQCTANLCQNGQPGHAPLSAGTPCTEGGGKVCDGAGRCVECVENADCASLTCVDHACAPVFCLDDAACDDGIDCTVDACDEATDTCTHTPDDDRCDDGNQCAAAVCDPASGCVRTPRPAGTPCSQDGGTVCDGAGSCVTPALCTPGETWPCYSGPDGTEGVGVCKAGIRTCAPDGSAWGPCQGEVAPGIEVCNGLDDDCDGVEDDGAFCPGALNATGVCVAGACTVVCDPGYANCGGDTGCETHLASDRANCGVCGNACSEFEPVCFHGICTNA